MKRVLRVGMLGKRKRETRGGKKDGSMLTLWEYQALKPVAGSRWHLERWQSALRPGACGSSLSGFGCGLAVFLQRSGDKMASRVEEAETNVIQNLVILLFKLKKTRGASNLQRN